MLLSMTNTIVIGKFIRIEEIQKLFKIWYHEYKPGLNISFRTFKSFFSLDWLRNDFSHRLPDPWGFYLGVKYGVPLWHYCCVRQQRKQYFSSQKISPSVFNLTTLRFLTSHCPCRDFYGNYFDKNVTDLKLQLFLQNVSPSAPGGKLLAGTRHVHDQCSDKFFFTSFRRFSKVSVKTAEMP